MATKNNHTDVIDNAIDTIPRSITTTGIVTKANLQQLIGVGSLFTTEVQVGDFIFIEGISEIQKVQSIISDTELYLEEGFVGAVSGVAYRRVKKNQYTMISWLVDADGEATIDGVVFPADASSTVDEYKTNSGGRGNMVDPIIIDSTTNGNKVYVQVKTN